VNPYPCLSRYWSMQQGIEFQSTWTLQRLTGPNLEPVTLTEAKAQMRVDTTDEDDFHTALIVVAREWCEWYTGRALIDQTWQMRLEGYSAAEGFALRRSPVIAIDSFFYDVNGVATELDDTTYVLDGAGTKWPRLLLAHGKTWPNSFWEKPLTIQFRAGYANRAASPTEGAEKVPSAFKHAIKMIVDFLDKNRDASPDMAPNVKWLLDQERADTGFA
jgi:uncharacterized phiE125 gp8 family phage protein